MQRPSCETSELTGSRLAALAALVGVSMGSRRLVAAISQAVKSSDFPNRLRKCRGRVSLAGVDPRRGRRESRDCRACDARHSEPASAIYGSPRISLVEPVDQSADFAIRRAQMLDDAARVLQFGGLPIVELAGEGARREGHADQMLSELVMQLPGETAGANDPSGFSGVVRVRFHTKGVRGTDACRVPESVCL